LTSLPATWAASAAIQEQQRKEEQGGPWRDLLGCFGDNPQRSEGASAQRTKRGGSGIANEMVNAATEMPQPENWLDTSGASELAPGCGKSCCRLRYPTTHGCGISAMPQPTKVDTPQHNFQRAEKLCALVCADFCSPFGSQCADDRCSTCVQVCGPDIAAVSTVRLQPVFGCSRRLRCCKQRCNGCCFGGSSGTSNCVRTCCGFSQTKLRAATFA
jgi:hypothetical protein